MKQPRAASAGIRGRNPGVAPVSKNTHPKAHNMTHSKPIMTVGIRGSLASKIARFARFEKNIVW